MNIEANCAGLLQIIITDVRLVAEGQQAEEEGREDDLNADEEPHGPEKHLAHLLQYAETACGPLPGDAGTTDETDQKQRSPEYQARLKRNSLQPALQGNRAA